MQQSIVKFYCFVVKTLLNKFRVLLCPSSGARQTAVAASNKPTTAENTSTSTFIRKPEARNHYNAHHREPVKLPLQPLTNRPRLRTLPPPHSYGNQRLQRQFDGLLMMGIVMPETCWAVSVRQRNKFYDWLLHIVGCFIWVINLIVGNTLVFLYCQINLGKKCQHENNLTLKIK